MNYKVHGNLWSGDRKILNWDKENFYELLNQITYEEIEIMNGYLDSEGFDVRGLSESRKEYVEQVLFTYIKDWVKLLIETDSIHEAKEVFESYCAALASLSTN